MENGVQTCAPTGSAWVIKNVVIFFQNSSISAAQKRNVSLNPEQCFRAQFLVCTRQWKYVKPNHSTKRVSLQNRRSQADRYFCAQGLFGWHLSWDELYPLEYVRV